MRGGHGGPSENSRVREPLPKGYDEYNQAMLSRIPMYLLDADDPYSTTTRLIPLQEGR